MIHVEVGGIPVGLADVGVVPTPAHDAAPVRGELRPLDALGHKDLLTRVHAVPAGVDPVWPGVPVIAAGALVLDGQPIQKGECLRGCGWV